MKCNVLGESQEDWSNEEIKNKKRSNIDETEGIPAKIVKVITDSSENNLSKLKIFTNEKSRYTIFLQLFKLYKLF